MCGQSMLQIASPSEVLFGLPPAAAESCSPRKGLVQQMLRSSILLRCSKVASLRAAPLSHRIEIRRISHFGSDVKNQFSQQHMDDFPEQRALVRSVCSRFPEDYWRNLDSQKMYPVEFTRACTDAGFFAQMIPREYGGSAEKGKQIGIAGAVAMLEEMHMLGSNGGCIHGLMYILGVIINHGTEQQKKRWLPKLANGRLRLQSSAFMEKESGLDFNRIRTTAVKDGDHYILSGAKSWTSRLEYSDLLLVLTRTRDVSQPADQKSSGLTVLVVDVRKSLGSGLTIAPIQTMLNFPVVQVFFDNLWVPEENVIGQINYGLDYAREAVHAQRILCSAECVGDAYWFLHRALEWAHERRSGAHPIAVNQGIQYPLARAYISAESAYLMVKRAAALFESGSRSPKEANMAKFLSAHASWEAAEACMNTYGLAGFSVDNDIERKWREARLFQTAPISTNDVLSFISENALGLPGRST